MQELVTEQNIGYRLKDARRKLNLTQAELGALVCLDQAMISRIEQGRHALRVDTLFKLLSALNYELLMQPKEDWRANKKEPDAW